MTLEAVPAANLALLNSRLDNEDAVQKKRELDAIKANLKGGPNKDKKLREACRGFESVFITKLWQEMRASIPKDGYLHGKEEERYMSMFDKEFADKMTEAGGIGLSDMLYKQLKSQTEEASRYSSPSAAREPLPLKPLSADQAGLAKPLQSNFGPDLAMKTGTASDASALYTPLDTGTQADQSDQAAQMNQSEFRGLIQKDAAEETTPKDSDKTAADLEVLATDAAAKGKDDTRIASGEETTAVLEKTTPPAKLHWPLNKPVVSEYGWRSDPFTGKRHWHPGVDIGGAPGDPIEAALDGKVIFSGQRSGYGNMVILEHEAGWRSYYGHASENVVKVGETVKAGQKIAKVGNTGRSTGPHLHFEMRQNGLAWNPKLVEDNLKASAQATQKQ